MAKTKPARRRKLSPVGRTATKSTDKQLRDALVAYLALKDQQRKVEEQLDQIRKQLLEQAVIRGGTAETDKHTVKVITSERRTIEREKLLERGVTPAIIDYATKKTEVVYPKVSEKKAVA